MSARTAEGRRADRERRRTCVGCRRVAPPEELVRVARTPDGALAVGAGAPGRGAWFCRASPGCFDRAVRRRALGRALRRELSSDELEVVRARLFGGAEREHGPEDER